MAVEKPGPDYLRVLAVADRGENNERDWLRDAAEAFLADKDWTPPLDVVLPSGFVLDKSFGAVALGAISPADFVFEREVDSERKIALASTLTPGGSKYFAIRGYIKPTSPTAIPQQIDGWDLYADPSIQTSLTCGTDPAVGSIQDAQAKLDVARLMGSKLHGAGVAVALVDSGIFLPHLTRINLLTGKDEKDFMRPRPKYPIARRAAGELPILDCEHSWKPRRVATPTGGHRIGHGTMCAYNVLAIAPRATLLDYPSLIARPPGDHTVRGTVSAAMHAYVKLLSFWTQKPHPQYTALVVNNSWGIFHPCEEDFPPGHPGRFIDNGRHWFHCLVWHLSIFGADIVFSAGNGGLPCPAPPFLHVTNGSIRGANAYAEVLTVAGCDVNDQRVGYSSQGPAVSFYPSPTPDKPDLTAYTHFLGSQVFGEREPDRGTSTACPIAAGCVAALRTKLSASAIPSMKMFDALRDTARPIGTAGWNKDYGRGIIDPVAAGRKLGLTIP